jgi:hypothetical protein
MIEVLNLIGKRKNPAKAKASYEVPVGTLTWSTGKVQSVNLKFHEKAVEAMGISADIIAGKVFFKSITFFETDDKKIGAFNSTPFGEEISKSEVSKMHNVKLLRNHKELFKKLYEFKDGENWAFKLITKKDQFLGKPIDTFIFEKLNKLEDSKPKERSGDQIAQDAKIKDWFEGERAEGRTPTIARYWEEKEVPIAID